MERMNQLTQKDGYAISFNYDCSVSVTADKSRIAQAVYNLLLNAVDFTGSDKKIYVSQRVSGHRVRISVRDTGKGIPSEILPHIWDRYYSQSSGRNKGKTGTGLGLSIVKTVCELHGGACGVQTNGQGSTFWFELPV